MSELWALITSTRVIGKTFNHHSWFSGVKNFIFICVTYFWSAWVVRLPCWQKREFGKWYDKNLNLRILANFQLWSRITFFFFINRSGILCGILNRWDIPSVSLMTPQSESLRLLKTSLSINFRSNYLRIRFSSNSRYCLNYRCFHVVMCKM